MSWRLYSLSPKKRSYQRPHLLLDPIFVINRRKKCVSSHWFTIFIGFYPISPERVLRFQLSSHSAMIRLHAFVHAYWHWRGSSELADSTVSALQSAQLWLRSTDPDPEGAIGRIAPYNRYIVNSSMADIGQGITHARMFDWWTFIYL